MPNKHLLSLGPRGHEKTLGSLMMTVMKMKRKRRTRMKMNILSVLMMTVVQMKKEEVLITVSKRADSAG